MNVQYRIGAWQMPNSNFDIWNIEDVHYTLYIILYYVMLCYVLLYYIILYYIVSYYASVSSVFLPPTLNV